MQTQEEKILLAHGSGGKLTHKLVQDIFFEHLANDILLQADDAGIATLEHNRIAFSTDCFVVTPLFFPGGDIGKLAICGTVNDLAVSGARPLYLSCGFIIEEGFRQEDLNTIVQSMGNWAQRAGVKIVAGDTKVVERGKADGLFITTAGVGTLVGDCQLGIAEIRAGDRIILTGTIGDHELAILGQRKGMEFESSVLSDCAPLGGLVGDLLQRVSGVRFMRDATRGGVATVLSEIVDRQQFGLLIEEDTLPVSGAVRGVCELLGFDPLYMANEGKIVVVVSQEEAQQALEAIKQHEYGRDACIVGEVTEENAGTACIRTRYGATKILDMLTGEQLPRIC